MEPLPASFYGKIDKKNPVISAFDNEIKEFMGYMKRMSTSVNFDYESYARGSKNVFEIWNKYKPRLPACYFEENLLLVADFLYRIKLYKMALWQGYGRYLQQFSSVIDNDITDINQFKNIFFPRGFEADNAKLTFRALQGHCLCSFQLESENEGRLQSQASVQKLLDILAFLRLMMQAVLSHERLCWILYNGSLHIYTISRHLMAMGHSAQALEYLLWASVCMEMTVPLLTVKYLPWRATLYAAVCQCYYDCQAGLQAEVFARRALGKVSELSQLQEMSVSPQSPETQRSFREATVKVAVMLFKRAVYEPRRKPKGLFRPKLKSNLKEIQNLPWPRTPSERLLVELFEGSAAQFLALLEALGDSTRRPLQTGLPEEPELQEVALELLFAGISILAGGGGGSADRGEQDMSPPPPISGIRHSCSLLQLTASGENGVSVEGAVKFVKLLFRYEQWEMFISLASLMIPLLQSLDAPMWFKEELDLKLLVAMEPLITGQKYKYTTKESNVVGEGGQERDKSSGPVVMSDDLLALAETLYTCVCVQAKGMAPDLDLTLDIVLFLWMKCKTVFQRVQTGHSDPIRSLYKLDNCDKWVRLLWLVSEAAHSCGLAQTDPAVMAELSLRLAVALESSADSTLKSGRKAGRAQDSSAGPPPDPTDVLSILKRTPVEQLQVAYDLLERAVESVAWGRAVSPPAGAVGVANTTQLQCMRSTVKEVSDGHSSSFRTVCSPDILQLFTMDLHLELLSVQHRIAIKLIIISSDLQHVDNKSIKSVRLSVNVEHPHQTNSTVTEPTLLEKIKKNKVCRALFLMQKALCSSGKEQTSSANKKLLEEAVSLLEKVDIEEKRLLIENSVQKGRKEWRNGVPPAPILLSRTYTSMTFMPAPYSPAQQVCWYLIFGRTSTGSNLKARLSDCHLPGTGEQVPAGGECVLRVQGLEPNEKYIFAVAAYDASGKMIGDAIGESTRPVLASPPLPLLTAWAHLAQAAYETGHYPLSVKASGVLWKHFTQTTSPEAKGLPEPGAGAQQPTQTRLVSEALTQASPLLLQLFLSTIFMQTDIRVHEGKLFCDSLCDGGPLIWGQVARLAECERMLVALDLALWLNDSSVALQAVVECYGLLAPIIYHRIPSDSVVEVLMKCLAVLQELPGVFRQKRSVPVQESLQHMVACMTYYMAKVLRSCQEYRLASAVIDMGKKLLLESTESSGSTLGVQNKPPIAEEQGAQRERSQKRPAAMQPEEEMNEQLKALEASVLKTRRLGTILHQDTNSWNKGVLELTGQEEPSVLYSVIATYQLKSAYKEVLKFKRKARFLEFAVQLLQRALAEDQLDLLLHWGLEINSWLNRRDESLTGMKKARGCESRGQGGGGVELKRYTATVTEYSKKPKAPAANTYWGEKKKKEFVQRKQLAMPKGPSNVRECRPVETLLKLLAPLVRGFRRRRRLRQVCSDEWPWRCQLNATLALAHFTLFRRNLEQRQSGNTVSYGQLDTVLFSLPHAGTLVRWSSVIHRRQALEPPDTPISAPRTPQKPVPRRQDDVGLGGGESTESEMDSDQDTPRTQMTNETDSSCQSLGLKAARHSVSQAQLLDTLGKTALHFRRAMVLAHRGWHWACLQWVCRTLWDQFTPVICMLEHGSTTEHPFPISLEQIYSTLTPLLLLASECLLNMIQRLQEEPGTQQAWADDAEGADSSLHFSRPLDDGTVVDLRWVGVLTLRTLELLHQQGRWEGLAHLAMVFNTITHERYTHLITPLLVHAQRQLLERVTQFGGPQPPQPHFARAEEETGERITCRNFIGKQLVINSTFPEEIHPGSHIDPGGHEIFSERSRAMALVSVPLDVADTLRCFRETSGRGHYHHRALQHSRTLLLLLLAHAQQGGEPHFCRDSTSHFQGKVEFNAATISVPIPFPPDLSSEDFSKLNTIYSSPLPHSLLATVITSYNNAIEFLQANNQNSLKVQALHELGNLHFYSGNKRASQSCWSKALDSALCQPGVLGSWDKSSVCVGSSDLPQHFLRQAGIWGCLQGAVLSAKIAQYILTSDISRQTHCCILSARLFKALLRGSLPHPLSDWEYASYGLGRTWDCPELIPGVELFTEPFRAQVNSTVSSLAFLCHRLHSAGHCLMVLPLLSLYLYFVNTLCRDKRRTIEGRILKVQVLTDLGLFSDAVRELGSLLQGERIPQPQGSYYPSDKRLIKKKFDTSKTLLDSANLQTLEDLVNKSLSSEVAALFGSQLVMRLTLAKTKLIVALCDTINSFPEFQGQDSEQKFGAETHTPSTPVVPKSPCSEREETRSCSSSRRARDPHSLQLDTQREKLTPARLKGVLLGEATRTLNSLLEALLNLGSVAEELEVAVEAKLLLSAIALQQGQAGVSASQAVSALQLLQESPLFKERTPPPHRLISSALKLPGQKKEQAGSTSVSEVEEEDGLEEDAVSLTSEVPPHSAEARERLGAPLWLRCRLGAARAFASHIPGMAIRPESSEDGARLLKEGLKEAQAWGDPETQAQLLLLKALLEAHKGMNREEITPLFQEAVSLLSDRRWLSPLSALVLAKATLHLSDLKGTGTHSLYSLTQRLLQQQLSALGESVELAEGGVVLFHQSSGPKNTYLPHGPVLAKVTLRLGHVLAQQAAHHPGTDSGQWVVAKQVLESALQLCQVSASRDRELEADILYYKGVVERWLVSLSECKPQTAVDTFLEAITVSRSHNHNLPLVHRCYLEMAVLYLQQWAQISLSSQGKENSGDTAPVSSAATPGPPTKGREGKQKPPSWRRAQTPTDRPLSVQDVQQLLCWVCVRAAVQVSEASARCAKLSGSTSAKAGPLQASLRSLPAFAANDLLRGFPPPASGETEELLKSTISPFPEKESCGTGEKDTKLTWVHLTRYYTHLQKLYSIANRPAVPGCADSLWSQALDGGLALRLAQLHRFLSTHLPPYRGHCCPPEPPTQLLDPSKQGATTQPRLDSSAGQESEIGLGGLDSFASASTDRELCVQWYCPALHTGHTQPVILLVFACNTRPLSAVRPSGGGLSGLHCGHRWIPLHRLQAVHAQLCSLCVDAEQSAPPVASSPSPQVEKRRQARTPGTGQALDPPIQGQAKQCCAQVKSLLLDLPETVELTEVPFELSNQALRDLEQCFNPARGFVLQAGSVFDWLMSLLV
ncbi:cilia- and flagella-associated protein 54 isoform X2 [Lepisosteus oculatus]|uniref:cilia- and flagella-associated protein 54 isoform X2 n=1 Tax=Lepisosteus oculatus TaxID=7918 RepID=UPI0037154250